MIYFVLERNTTNNVLVPKNYTQIFNKYSNYTGPKATKISVIFFHFSNSLITHPAKTKEIMTVTEVWVPGLN